MRKTDRRLRRDVHGLDENGAVACNPRDREARHRAAVDDIRVGALEDVTCSKCLKALHRSRRERSGV